MSIRIDDLPEWAQRQAAQKIMAENRTTDKPAPKYHNQKARRIAGDGTYLTFDSQKEAMRFDQLIILFRTGEIRDLKIHPEFTLQEAYTTTDGKRVRAIRYEADFSYERRIDLPYGDEHWLLTVEDVKSEATKTRVYSIKRKLMQEKYGISIKEVM